MAALTVSSPYKLFTDIDGNPLESGYIYIGTAGLNAEASPIQAYWDAALTAPAVQPIRTIGGHASRNGAAANIYVDASDYSVVVKNKNMTLTYSALYNVAGTENIPTFASKADAIAWIDLYGIVGGQQFFVTSEDGGSFIGKTGAAAATYADDGGAYCGTQFIPTGGDGSSALVREYSGTADARWFGAANDVATDSAASVALMAASLGYVAFSVGTYLISTSSISVPIIFSYGASLTVATGNTLTIAARIESPRQYIFQGDGDYVLTQSGGGEESRQVHASWFGAFPNANTGVADQAPYIQKAFDSVGDLRESVVQFDNGNYVIKQAMTVGRGTAVIGVGTRRTVFRLEASGFDVFTTINQACKFENIQFEAQFGVISSFTGAYINIQHDHCEIYNVDVGEGSNPIIIDSNNCRVKNIKFGGAHIFGAGSAIVNIRGGQLHEIEDIVNATSPGSTHESIVNVGGSATGTISAVSVRGVKHFAAVPSVLIEATSGNVSGVTVSGVKSNASTGTTSEAIILKTGNTHSLTNILIDQFVINAQPTNGILLDQSSTGEMSEIVIDNGIIIGSSGIGIDLQENAGTLSNITVGSGVDIKDRATPISFTGSPSGVKIAPNVWGASYAGVTFDTGNVGDDSAYAINMGQDFSGQIMLSSLTDFIGRGVFAFKTSGTPFLVNVVTVNSLGLYTGALTGTTGTDTQVNLSVDSNGLVYVENRTGATRRFFVTVLAANA